MTKSIIASHTIETLAFTAPCGLHRFTAAAAAGKRQNRNGPSIATVTHRAVFSLGP